METEKERFEILMEDMEKKFDAVIDGLISLRQDFRELRNVVAHQQELDSPMPSAPSLTSRENVAEKRSGKPAQRKGVKQAKKAIA